MDLDDLIAGLFVTLAGIQARPDQRDLDGVARAWWLPAAASEPSLDFDAIVEAFTLLIEDCTNLAWDSGHAAEFLAMIKQVRGGCGTELLDDATQRLSAQLNHDPLQRYQLAVDVAVTGLLFDEFGRRLFLLALVQWISNDDRRRHRPVLSAVRRLRLKLRRRRSARAVRPQRSSRAQQPWRPARTCTDQTDESRDHTPIDARPTARSESL